MKLKFYTIRKVIVVLCLMIFAKTEAQVTGTVFRDVNSNGIRDLTLPIEPGEFGVTVNAYNATNTLIATTTTNALGIYLFTPVQIVPGTAVRLEFIYKSGDYPAKRTGADRSNIQFVTAGVAAINIDFAVAAKKLLNNNANPYVAGTAYTNGDATATGAGNAGEYDALYVFPFDLSSNGGSTRRAKNQFLGSIFGLAWQRESRILFMSAYLKRHAGFGPNGIGAIYKSQIDMNGIPSTPTLLLDVNTLGINVGTDPRTVALPASASSPNTDPGVFGEVGKRGIGGMELAPNGRDLYIVNMYEKKLHRINIGNPLKASYTSSDVTGTWSIPDPGIAGTEWHPMAAKIYQGKIYVGGVCTKETTTAHNIADTAGLSGVVYELDISSGSSTFVEVIRFPLTSRRGFTNSDYRYEFRNNYWSAWQNNGDISLGGPLRSGLIGATTGTNATGIYYAQPMLSAIEFDIDGSMIIGMRDRFGDQGGYANYFETGNVPGESYRVLASGAVLRAGKNGSSWTLENAGSVTTNGVTTTTPGLADNNPAQTGSFTGMTGTPWGGSYGPGGGYYYYNQNFTLTGVPAPFNVATTVKNHYLKTNGGLAFLPGYNEVLNTAIDPMSTGFSNGIIKNYNLGANAGNMSARMELIVSATGDPASMGKAAALGDIELLLDAQEVEIGNRVWDDANGNGRQDAGEPGIAGVDVVLRSPGADNVYNTGDDQVWTTTTDANGNYYFDNTIVNDNRRPTEWIGVSSTNSGILPGFEYKIEIDNAQASVLGKILTAVNNVNDAIDSDGSYNVTTAEYIINPGGSTAANSSFENNYNIDFGFTSHALLPYSKLDFTATLVNNATKLTWTTQQEYNINKYEIERSFDGQSFNKIDFAYSKGNGSFSYLVNDNSLSGKSGKIYYRLRITEKSGLVRYSDIVYINLKSSGKVGITPNPFIGSVNIQITTDRKENLGVSIYNAAGQVMYSNKLIANEGFNSFNLSGLDNLAKGFYVIEVRGESLVQRQKMLKQ